MPEVIEQPFRLLNSNSNITEADGTASQWSDLWSYQVPNGTTLIIMPHHTFAAYLEDSSPAEVGDATCRIKVEKRDPSGSDVVLLYGPKLYLASKEFQEKSKMARFGVPAEGVVVGERQLLVISAYDDGTIDASDSYFEAHIGQLRKAINA